jgi:hypothetical protein
VGGLQPARGFSLAPPSGTQLPCGLNSYRTDTRFSRKCDKWPLNSCTKFARKIPEVCAASLTGGTAGQPCLLRGIDTL